MIASGSSDPMECTNDIRSTRLPWLDPTTLNICHLQSMPPKAVMPRKSPSSAPATPPNTAKGGTIATAGTGATGLVVILPFPALDPAVQYDPAMDDALLADMMEDEQWHSAVDDLVETEQTAVSTGSTDHQANSPAKGEDVVGCRLGPPRVLSTGAGG